MWKKLYLYWEREIVFIVQLLMIITKGILLWWDNTKHCFTKQTYLLWLPNSFTLHFPPLQLIGSPHQLHIMWHRNRFILMNNGSRRTKRTLPPSIYHLSSSLQVPINCILCEWHRNNFIMMNNGRITTKNFLCFNIA